MYAVLEFWKLLNRAVKWMWATMHECTELSAMLAVSVSILCSRHMMWVTSMLKISRGYMESSGACDWVP